MEEIVKLKREKMEEFASESGIKFEEILKNGEKELKGILRELDREENR